MIYLQLAIMGAIGGGDGGGGSGGSGGSSWRERVSKYD